MSPVSPNNAAETREYQTSPSGTLRKVARKTEGTGSSGSMISVQTKAREPGDTFKSRAATSCAASGFGAITDPWEAPGANPIAAQIPAAAPQESSSTKQALTTGK